MCQKWLSFQQDVSCHYFCYIRHDNIILSPSIINHTPSTMSVWLCRKQKFVDPQPETIRDCYKCGLTFINPARLTGHINRCRGTAVTEQRNTALSFTQREMLKAISNKDGQYSLQNNTYVGEAYQGG